VGQLAPPPPPQRARSFRIYGIVLMLFLLCFLAMVTAVATVLVGAVGMSSADAQPSPAVTTTKDVDPKPAVADQEPDSGFDPADVPPPPPPKKVVRTKKPPVSGDPRPVVRTKTSSTAPGTIAIEASGATFLGVEVKCPGARKRAAFSNGKATVQGIPSGEECELFFKGGMPAKYRGVRAGHSYSCTFPGGTAVCK